MYTKNNNYNYLMGPTRQTYDYHDPQPFIYHLSRFFSLSLSHKIPEIKEYTKLLIKQYQAVERRLAFFHSLTRCHFVSWFSYLSACTEKKKKKCRHQFNQEKKKREKAFECRAARKILWNFFSCRLKK